MELIAELSVNEKQTPSEPLADEANTESITCFLLNENENKVIDVYERQD